MKLIEEQETPNQLLKRIGKLANKMKSMNECKTMWAPRLVKKQKTLSS